MKKLSKKEWIAVAVAGVFVAYTLFGSNIMSLFRAEDMIDSLASASQSENSSGVIINDIMVGTGAEVKAGDTASMHYLLSLSDGTTIQNSKDFGQPFVFVLGAGQVIPGMEQGITGMKVGGVRSIIIPPSLGYGAQQMGPIPPNSTLVFTIELVDVVSAGQAQ